MSQKALKVYKTHLTDIGIFQTNSYHLCLVLFIVVLSFFELLIYVIILNLCTIYYCCICFLICACICNSSGRGKFGINWMSCRENGSEILKFCRPRYNAWSVSLNFIPACVITK